MCGSFCSQGLPIIFLEKRVGGKEAGLGRPPGFRQAWVDTEFPFQLLPGRPNKRYQGLRKAPVKVTLLCLMLSLLSDMRSDSVVHPLPAPGHCLGSGQALQDSPISWLEITPAFSSRTEGLQVSASLSGLSFCDIITLSLPEVSSRR